MTTTAEKFWAKVGRQTHGCWLWRGSRTSRTERAYGQFWDGTRLVMAHRWAYEEENGPIPEGLQLDHLCRTRLCVNPAHLEPVTQRENILRGEGPTARNATATHCPKGHEYTPENTVGRTNGVRECRACKRELDRARYWRRKRKRERADDIETALRRALQWAEKAPQSLEWIRSAPWVSQARAALGAEGESDGR